MKVLLKTTTDVRVIADSAVGRNNQPWFLPDFGENWCWRTAMAFRVSKLGKNVSPRYAERYLDAVTLLWVAEAADCNSTDYMDGSVVCGNWLPVNNIPEQVAEFLAEITMCATVKNGDIIAIMTSDPSKPINLNEHISLNLDENEVLSFNINSQSFIFAS